jgi:hypothetical protein
MASPFVDIVVQPSYGPNRAIIRWMLLEGYEEGEVFVYKSKDGVRPWELLNDVPVPAAEGFFEDTELVALNKINVFHYRVLLVFKGKEFDSPIISMYDKLTRREYAGARKILNQEYKRMKSGNGVQVFLYKPLVSGEPCSQSDPDTKQQFNPDCVDLDPDTGLPDQDKDCFGQLFVGGFNPPTQTWMEFMKVGPIIITDYKDGTGSVDERMVKARILAFPILKRSDMIVHPATDNRYGIKDVEVFYFKGIVPVAMNLNMELLSRDDARYRMPIPQLLNDPTNGRKNLV